MVICGYVWLDLLKDCKPICKDEGCSIPSQMITNVQKAKSKEHNTVTKINEPMRRSFKNVKETKLL